MVAGNEIESEGAAYLGAVLEVNQVGHIMFTWIETSDDFLKFRHLPC